MKDYPVITSVERIRPGRWFVDGGGRKMLKIQDIYPSGLPLALVQVDPILGTFHSDFAVNAIDDKGLPCCCPYEMEIFHVKSEDDLYLGGNVGPTVRHLPIQISSPIPLRDSVKRIVKNWPDHVLDDGIAIAGAT